MTSRMLRQCVLYITAMVLFGNCYALELRSYFKKTASTDTVYGVWVIFTDKTAQTSGAMDKRATQRRAKAGFIASTTQDIPVTHNYISRVEQLGGQLRNVFKWANAASFNIPSSRLAQVASLPFVRDMLPVRSFNRTIPATAKTQQLSKKTGSDSSTIYGYSYTQQHMLMIPAAHRFIQSTTGKAPGDSVLVAVFDGGFWLHHSCFSYIKNHNAVVVDSDFVQRDNDVADGDSLRKLYLLLGEDPPEAHGTATLSLLAGYALPSFTGAAWGAHYVLAKTEYSSAIINNAVVEMELHSEEDNWAAAVVWAESLGVDIVSSSLGYFSGFTDSLGNADTSLDYSFSDLDGATTIISIAATEAAKRGMIIVNAAGNEGPSAGSLSAPADVKDVITVGGVEPDKSIASFSSRGPTADNRIKPDLVAQATSIYAANPYSVDSASYFDGLMGTSFSTPQVAGVCALIRQKFPKDSSAQIRQRLYRSCFFTPNQHDTDNTYGRGIPDALLGCLADSMSYLFVTDSAGHALNHAVVRYGNGADSAVCDSFGIAIVPVEAQVPETLSITHTAYARGTAVLLSRHTRAQVMLRPLYSLHVVLADTAKKALPGIVYYKTRYDTGYSSSTVDSLGEKTIAGIYDSSVTVYAKFTGYFTSAETVIRLRVDAMTVDTITLVPRSAAQFILYPTILDIVRKHQHLTLAFVASQDNPRSYSQLMRASIRTISGTLVWSYSTNLSEQKPITVTWPESNRTVAPGMYYFIVEYAGKTYKKKFIVLG